MFLTSLRNFTKSEHFPPQVENQMSTYSPDAYLVVYAVDDEPSLDQADRSGSTVIFLYTKLITLNVIF